MTSPTTMRLVGLLVIVGVVAGCGDHAEQQELRSDVAAQRADVALTLADVEALSRECEQLKQRVLPPLIEAEWEARPFADSSAHEKALVNAYDHLTVADRAIQQMRSAVSHGAQVEAHTRQEVAREHLGAASHFLDRARKSKSEE